MAEKHNTVKTIESKDVDWKQITRQVLRSRYIDHMEEERLVPEKKVLYQFSARGHDMPQIVLGNMLTHHHDGVSAYYRSRPLMLANGLTVEDGLAAPMAKSGGYSDGRDIGVVCNMPGKFRDHPTVLPMSGDVGSQYTPAVGWAQSLIYRRDTLGEAEYDGAISVVHGGEGSVATNGFWSALTIATTLNLPVLFYIEDNAYGISVPRDLQTPGGNIAENLQSFKNLYIVDGDGTAPVRVYNQLASGVNHVRQGKGPALVRLEVPRLSGHAGHDTQAYKDEARLEWERKNDPLPKLRKYVLSNVMSRNDWDALEHEVQQEVEQAVQAAEQRPDPDPKKVTRHVLFEGDKKDLQEQGGLHAEGHAFPETSVQPQPEKQRINIVDAVRRTLAHELSTNPKLMVFGEDVGPKGGVHAVTLGLQSEFGEDRVFDTSLSEEGIIGRAVGMALNGLMPVAEIQFRKYADPATEQLKNCGTMRWRTANRFAAPIVVRMPGGFAKVGDPWHSESNEVFWTHCIGWQMAYPSNAEDAVGLLRSAMRSNDPTIFFEHRAMLDARWARRPYPGDDYVVPFGKARFTREGDQLTIVTWGAMVEQCEMAVDETGVSADVIDLRTLMPWDRQAVLDSIGRTNRCLIVHEDGETAGFGAEISAVLAREAFTELDAPVERLATPDVPIPHNVDLMNAVVPGADTIAERIREVVAF